MNEEWALTCLPQTSHSPCVNAASCKTLGCWEAANGVCNMDIFQYRYRDTFWSHLNLHTKVNFRSIIWLILCHPLRKKVGIRGQNIFPSSNRLNYMPHILATGSVTHLAVCQSWPLHSPGQLLQWTAVMRSLGTGACTLSSHCQGWRTPQWVTAEAGSAVCPWPSGRTHGIYYMEYETYHPPSTVPKQSLESHCIKVTS